MGKRGKRRAGECTARAPFVPTVLLSENIVGTNSGGAMRAANKDQSIFNMLKSERNRCVELAESLRREIDGLPKGSLGERKVKSGDREYIYPCLRYRDGKKVVYEHLSRQRAEELKPILERRKKLESSLKANKKRIATIDSILAKGE